MIWQTKKVTGTFLEDEFASSISTSLANEESVYQTYPSKIIEKENLADKLEDTVPINTSHQRVTHISKIFRVHKKVDPVKKIKIEPFTTIQAWSGEIIEIEDDHFIAKLIPIDKNTHKYDSSQLTQSEFLIEELPIDERAYVILGAVFKWHIGYRRSIYGQLKNSDMIVFDIKPVWNADFIKKIEEKSLSLVNLMSPDQCSRQP